MDWSTVVVTLVRHIGAQVKPMFGLLPVEHPQKRVLVTMPGQPKLINCGYLTDVGKSVLWDPYVREALQSTPGIIEHIEAEAVRLRSEKKFNDPDPASYFYAGQAKPKGETE